MTELATVDGGALRLGMADIALLAKVQRPVVTSWRSRYAASERPFPPPAASERGQLLFDAADVAAWLQESGRGNNPQAGDDIAAFATMAEGSPRTDRVALETVSALVCLYAVAGLALDTKDSAGLLDAADAADPNDRYLFSEIEAAGKGVLPIASYANLLVDAAGGPAAAFETLMRERFRSGLAEHIATTIDSRALTVTARIAVELTAPSGTAVTYSDPSPGSSDLLLAVVAEHRDRGPIEVLTPPADDPTSRLVRRRLRAHDVYRERLSLDDFGVPDIDRPVTHVTCLPAPGQPVLSDADLLARVEAIAIQMDDLQQFVVLGPASALCDALTDSVASDVRDQLLRSGHIVAIVRLPAGLVTSRSRQRLAVWVLGPARYDRSSEAFTYVADLVNESLTPAVIDDIVTDLVAATAGRTLQRAHSARFLRSVATRLLIPPGRSLVERGAVMGSVTTSSAADLIIRAQEAVRQLEAPWTAAVLPTVSVREDALLGQASTVGDALSGPHLRSVPGHRLRPGDVTTGVGHPVLGVGELIGEVRVGARSVDQFVFARDYESGRLTEPGDVVFCTSPRPRALVDHEGASVVEYPARVLRIDAVDPGGLHADVVAGDINEQPATARAWRLWPVRRVPDDSRRGLDALLSDLRRMRDEVRARQQLLDHLTRTVTDGVTAGHLSLTPGPTKGR
ncbi:MAG: hypothetical protein ACR2JU_09705 [Nocardioidaceae bacterium]